MQPELPAAIRIVFSFSSRSLCSSSMVREAVLSAMLVTHSRTAHQHVHFSCAAKTQEDSTGRHEEGVDVSQARVCVVSLCSPLSPLFSSSYCLQSTEIFVFPLQNSYFQPNLSLPTSRPFSNALNFAAQQHCTRLTCASVSFYYRVQEATELSG